MAKEVRVRAWREVEPKDSLKTKIKSWNLKVITIVGNMESGMSSAINYKSFLENKLKNNNKKGK